MKWASVKDMLIGALMSVVVTAPALYFSGILDPVPYDRVEVLSASGFTGQDDDYLVVANFNKNGECTFVDLGAFGSYLGRVDRLKWFDPSAKYQDRLEGEHTLEIYIETEGVEYDYLEIRTRHTCGGEKVDRIFARIHLN